jgi:hypothetical protein
VRVIADYQGPLLNHVEALYRPGERAVAVALAEALGCAVSDTGFRGDGEESFLAVHPNPEDRDMQNNAFYMSPMRPEQQALEASLKRLSEADAAVGAQLDRYREAARTKPFGVPHFAIRYRSGDAVEQAMARLRDDMAQRLGDRLHLRLFRPEDPDRVRGSLVQGFVYQDVIVSGAFLLGQLIELQGQPSA